MKNSKELLDRMDILEKADLINEKAKEIKKKNKTITNSKAFSIASNIVLKGETWNY